jgi:LysR family transcriptional regulator, hydrogen peroxide-inducible genes activator
MIGAMVDLVDLHCFDVLARTMHFGHAADELGTSQSTLSRRIRRLEEEIGVVLLTRTSRRVALTESGRELATRLPSALRHLDAALSAARSPGDGGWEV